MDFTYSVVVDDNQAHEFLKNLRMQPTCSSDPVDYIPGETYGCHNGQYQRVEKLQFWRDDNGALWCKQFWSDGIAVQGIVVSVNPPLEHITKETTSVTVKWAFYENTNQP